MAGDAANSTATAFCGDLGAFGPLRIAPPFTFLAATGRKGDRPFVDGSARYRLAAA